MANNSRGIPPLPSTLIRQASPTDGPPSLAEPDEGSEPVEVQGRGDSRAPAPRPRKRRPAVAVEKTAKRGLYLTDAVWERLQLEAIRRKTSVSAIAGDVLERNLPRLRIERDA